MVWYGIAWYGIVDGMAWYAMVWYGIEWYGIWYGVGPLTAAPDTAPNASWN
jgi:hypothetical protein